MTIQLKSFAAAAFTTRKSAIAAMALAAMSGAALAFTTPAPGQLGYDLYNIVVNQGVLGPVGFMGR